jgi:putative flavoprotein involved in K+ transport
VSPDRDVIIIGGGHAGLSISKYLKDDGVDHVVLERNRVAHAWREERWDSFCLVTPNRECRLPGFPYSGPEPDGFMRKDEVVDYLEAFAASFDAPLIEGVEVASLRRVGNHGFALETGAGSMYARCVVVATGAYRDAKLPALARSVDPKIVHLHASSYRNPNDVPPGAVLVVGTGQSGSQIAVDLHRAGRRVHVATCGAPRTARRYRGRDVASWLEALGSFDRDSEDGPSGFDADARDIDLRAYAREGMQLYGRLSDARDGRLYFANDLAENLASADAAMDRAKDAIDAYIAREGLDAPSEARYRPVWQPAGSVRELVLARAGITSIVWCTGFEASYAWIDIPAAFDGFNKPAHRRGVTLVPGLYFLGLPWLHTRGSARFFGAARDARFLADHIRASARNRAIENLESSLHFR